MKSNKYIGIILLLLPLAILTGCGGGGDSAPPDANAPASLALAASKVMAIANGTDAVSLQASVTKADGTPVPDGTPVTFSVPAGTGTLSTATATTANGVASVTVKRDPVTGTTPNQVVTVTCTAGGAAGAKDVKFINTPTKVTVSVATKRALPNMGALDVQVDSTAGAAFDNAGQPVTAVNTAEGSLAAANFRAGTNKVSMINANGCNTGTAPIMEMTYSVVAAGGLPAFSVNPAGVRAADANGAAMVLVTAADIGISTKFDTE